MPPPQNVPVESPPFIPFTPENEFDQDDTDGQPIDPPPGAPHSPAIDPVDEAEHEPEIEPDPMQDPDADPEIDPSINPVREPIPDPSTDPRPPIVNASFYLPPPRTYWMVVHQRCVTANRRVTQ